MRTALFLLAEFVLFALGAITALLGVIIVLRVPLTLDALSLSTAGIMLLLFAIPYGFFKAAGRSTIGGNGASSSGIHTRIDDRACTWLPARGQAAPPRASTPEIPD